MLSPVCLAQWTVLRLLRTKKVLDADVVNSTGTSMVGASLALCPRVRLGSRDVGGIRSIP